MTEPPKVHGVDIRCFNTTTNRNKVYMALADSKRTLEADRLFDMWSYLYNRGVRILHHHGIIDRFGRTCRPIDDITLMMICEKKKLEVHSWRNFIIQLAFNPKNLPEWTRLYPRSMLECVADQLTAALRQDSFNLVERPTVQTTIDFSVSALRADLRGTKFWMDTRDRSNVLEFDMVNQYGNAANLIIKSNTSKSYDYMEALSQYLEQVGDSLRIILQFMEDRSKVLCTFRCELEGGAS